MAYGARHVIICPYPEDVMAVAHDHGINARVVGQITDSPHIAINSKGVEGASLAY